ncbi:MAG: hypothetical protein JW976_14805 [Syntrophaceae bacterium]|nr:hypothetical protein [Syntrophaceae bacterium]
MALPIAPTPKLDVKASSFFLRRIEKDLRKPMGAVATPRLNKAIKKIMADAHKNKK